jgi:RNA polymerase sigma factor (TIGR02999 family)
MVKVFEDPAIYDELHRLAQNALRREGSERSHTLQTTALVHEAWLRLADQKRVEWQNRAHFCAIAARMMRRVLVDYARARNAEKRGGGAHAITLEDACADVSSAVDLTALDDALRALESMDPGQARLVELRYFAGLTIDETAEALGVSPATVKREWAIARAWLRRELTVT